MLPSTATHIVKHAYNLPLLHGPQLLYAGNKLLHIHALPNRLLALQKLPYKLLIHHCHMRALGIVRIRKCATVHQVNSKCFEVIRRNHLEAGIAYWSTRKADTPEKWENILQLYNQLLQIEYSPIAALNRTFALAKANGKAEAIAEAEKLQLTDNHFYFTLLGELYSGVDDQKAVRHFERAVALAKTQGERQLLEKKIRKLG